MKLTVITSIFNAGKFLTKCLESVQSDPDETPAAFHLVVDACSSDGSIEILEDWKHCDEDGNHFSFLSEKDRGQSDGFNKGIALANSEWICWLNGDDELAPGAMGAFWETLKKNPTADVIYGHVQFIDEESKPVKIAYTFPYYHKLIRWGVWLPPSSGTFFRRELFIREPLDVDYHYVMDVEWFLRAGRNLKGVLVDKVMSHFRISTQGKTSGMIQTGAVTERHHEERERYRRKYIYSQWPDLTEDQARKRFFLRQKLAKIPYYLLKLRYVHRYVIDKFRKRAVKKF